MKPLPLSKDLTREEEQIAQDLFVELRACNAMLHAYTAFNAQSEFDRRYHFDRAMVEAEALRVELNEIARRLIASRESLMQAAE